MKISKLNIFRIDKEGFSKKINLSQKNRINIDNKHVKIEISKRAVEFNKVREAIDKLPEVRSEEINRIKEEINKNKYYVSSRDIARKIVMEYMKDKYALML